MMHTQPSLLDQQIHEAGQQVTVTITGEILSVRPAGHDRVILAIGSPTGRPDHRRSITYVMAGDPAVEVSTR